MVGVSVGLLRMLVILLTTRERTAAKAIGAARRVAVVVVAGRAGISSIADNDINSNTNS